MAAAPQSLRTKATSSAVSITLMGLTTAPGPQGRVVGDHPLPPVGRVQRDAIAGPYPDIVQTTGHPVA